MSAYRVGTQLIQANDPRLDYALGVAYAAKLRPVCACRPVGAEMYIAKISGKFVLKRMPNSGDTHASSCDSYEPPSELSGLGEVMGSAIKESPDDGVTTLKLDFSLTKLGRRAAIVPSGDEADSVKTDGTKLSLRGLLHYLWEQAGFNRWEPNMEGKRSWFVIRKFLLQAAESKTAKAASLPDLLYMPESFSIEKKDEIVQRRIIHLKRASTTEKGGTCLMVVVGEVKEVAPSRYGHKIVFKHLPDFHFMLNDDLHKRLVKRFQHELSLWDALESSRMVAIATFGIGPTGIASIEELALMGVTENWIPFEGTLEKNLLDAMTSEKRRFLKGMRYNLASNRPLACVVASDTVPEPTAMYIQPPGAGEEFIAALNALIKDSKLQSWVWRAGDSPMPALP